MTAIKLQDRVRKQLLDYLHDAGYSDVTDFWRRTKIQVSHETVRRALHGGKPTSVETFIKIAAHLGMPKAEIVEVCKDLGDTFWPGLLKTKESRRDTALLAVIKVLADNPATAVQLVSFLKLLAASIEVNIDHHLKVAERDIQNQPVPPVS